MRPIALARVRLSAGQNICGVSAVVFVAAGTAVRGEQTHGVVGHITLIDGGVLLFERTGWTPELVSLGAVATMAPTEDISGEHLGVQYILEREQKADYVKARKTAALSGRNEEAVHVPERIEVALVAAQASAAKPGAPPDAIIADGELRTRRKPGPKPKGGA